MAQIIDFTIKAVEGIAAPAETRAEFKDSKVAGLYLRVTPGGVKTFSFVGRAKGSSRVERVTIGKYPAVKPEEARRRAVELAGQMASGESAAASARSRRGEMTVGDLFKDYKERSKSSVRRIDLLESDWRLYIAREFQFRRLSEVTPKDVSRWHRGLPAEIVRRREVLSKERQAAAARKQAEREAARKRPAYKLKALPSVPTPSSGADTLVTGQRAANNALGLLHAMYAWAINQVRVHAGDNPARGIERFRQNERDRFIQPDELRPFFESLAAEPNQTMRDIFLLALLTGARRANVLSMRWADVNLARSEWRIPTTNNGEPCIFRPRTSSGSPSGLWASC